MDPIKLSLLQYYLDTLEYPPGITRQQQRFLDSQSKHYFTYNDRLYRRNGDSPRLVLTKSEADNCIWQFHFHPFGGHFATENTYYKISRKYFWETMKKDIKDAISRCDHCQRQKKQTRNELLIPIPIEPEPFRCWGLDIKHLKTSRRGSQYIIVCIDYFTKWAVAKAVRHANATEVATFLYEDIICKFGTPSSMIHDNGKPLANGLMEEVQKIWGFTVKKISPFVASVNGEVERLNKTIGLILRKLPLKERDDWCTYLPAALFSYNTIRQASTQKSPFAMLYGVDPNTPFDRLMDESTRTDADLDWTPEQIAQRMRIQLHKLRQIRQQAAATIKISQENQKKTIDKKVLAKRNHLLQPPFSVGDVVLVYNNAIETSWSGKLELKWLGPYIVHQVNNKNGYQLKTLQGDILRGVFHGNRLCIYKLPDVHFRPTLTASPPANQSLTLMDHNTAQQVSDMANIMPLAVNTPDNCMEDSSAATTFDIQQVLAFLGAPLDDILPADLVQMIRQLAEWEEARIRLPAHRIKTAETLYQVIQNSPHLRNKCANAQNRYKTLRDIYQLNDLPTTQLARGKSFRNLLNKHFPEDDTNPNKRRKLNNEPSPHLFIS